MLEIAGGIVVAVVVLSVGLALLAAAAGGVVLAAGWFTDVFAGPAEWIERRVAGWGLLHYLAGVVVAFLVFAALVVDGGW